MMSKTVSKDLTRPLTPRDPEEIHRAATPLELLFDLVSVIAIATAAAGLHHAISGAHALEGFITYIMAFFAIWWAWMNYTWYASAYDNDDTIFRLLTMVAMGGSLVIASGISRLFDTSNLSIVIAGYVIMRLAMIALWLRAAKYDVPRRKTALTYAVGIAVAQVFWISLLFVKPVSPIWLYGLFGVGVILELAVPAIAERRENTPWHREHIRERYGLLFIIVMGELLLGGALALKAAYIGTFDFNLILLAISSLIITFSMWWLYFSREDHLQSHKLSLALMWGYGHVFIFASAAAVGAGLAVMVDVMTAHSKVDLTTAAFSVAIPLVVYLLGLWFVRDRLCLNGLGRFILPVFSGLIILAAFSSYPLELMAILTAACVISRNRVAAT